MAMTMFDTEKFIGQIKKHPAIYDVNCLQYIDRTAKTNAWFEVCSAMIADWDSLSDEERAIEDKCLRNKWRNIRDYFMKEVKAQKKPGRGGRKRKRSTYYNHLLFLIPSVKKRGNLRRIGMTSSTSVYSSCSGTRSRGTKEPQMKNEIVITDDIEIVTTPEIDEYTLTGVRLGNHETTEDQYQRQTATGETSMASFDGEIPVDILSTSHANQRPISGDDDYDKMFLLSLLPSLRLIPEHMKLHVRIQIQQILASAFHSNNHHSSH